LVRNLWYEYKELLLLHSGETVVRNGNKGSFLWFRKRNGGSSLLEGGKGDKTIVERTQDEPNANQLTSEEILSYNVTRKFPLPLDAVYRLQPHVIKVKVHGGLEYLPKEGPALIAVKHQGFWDAYLLRLLVEKATGRKEDIYAFAGAGDFSTRKGSFRRLKSVLFRILTLFYNYGHATIPIRQGSWRKTLKRLAGEKNVLLLHSPEGFPSIEMTRAKVGIGLLQYDLGFPVIPIALWGLTPFFISRIRMGAAHFAEWLRCFPLLRHLPNPFYPKERETAHILIGEPLYPFPDQSQYTHYRDRKRLYQIYTDRIMEKIASMMPEEFRGYYKDKVKQEVGQDG
jgi:hypothetical protein